MTKKVTFGSKPRETKTTNPDEWVQQGAAAPETIPMKEDLTRFTIDIPTELHTRIKSQCAMNRVKMRDAIHAILKQHFPADS
jgi:hypothetical protein